MYIYSNKVHAYTVHACVHNLYCIYRIYPNRGPGLYFLRDIFDPASKRSRPLFGSGPASIFVALACGCDGGRPR